jgi:Zn-dependent protease with chaperone function
MTLGMTIGSSIVLIAVGAILKWAVTAHVSGINLQTAGTVLFVLGILGLILSVLYTFVWSRQRRTETTRTYVPRDEQTTRYQ